MSKQFYNYDAMQKARDANAALLQNLAFLPDEINMVDLKLVSYSSLCIGCTNPDAINYNPLAEIDDNSCL